LEQNALALKINFRGLGHRAGLRREIDSGARRAITVMMFSQNCFRKIDSTRAIIVLLIRFACG
jgi:hypothetical protein